MTILAFLQNAWFPPWVSKNHVKLYIENDSFRKKVLARSFTGRKLIRTLGEELYTKIIWDNISHEVGDYPGFCGIPSEDTVLNKIVLHRPKLILAFGRVSTQTLLKLHAEREINIPVMTTKHPNARHFPDSELENFGRKIKMYIQRKEKA